MLETKNPDGESFRVFYCQSENDGAWKGLFAGKPAPTVIGGVPNPVGAGLPAKRP
jgi:hypothetical protein